MTTRRFHPARRFRPAFTLMEIVLVLCILAAMAALVWPALDGPLANQRLRKAADQVRTEWSAARIEAMESGQTCVFRHVPQSDTFQVDCHLTELTADDPTFGGDFRGHLPDRTGESDEDGTSQPKAKHLPEGITFVAAETAVDTRAATIVSESDQPPAAGPGLSEPILFYPDGTTSTARLSLKNEFGRYIELTLRGLTGTVKVGQLYAAEEKLR